MPRYNLQDHKKAAMPIPLIYTSFKSNYWIELEQQINWKHIKLQSSCPEVLTEIVFPSSSLINRWYKSSTPKMQTIIPKIDFHLIMMNADLCHSFMWFIPWKNNNFVINILVVFSINCSLYNVLFFCVCLNSEST